MTRARGGAVLLAVTIATFVGAALSTARQPVASPSIDPDAFVVIVPVGRGVDRPTAASPRAIGDFLEPTRLSVRPVPSLPPTRAAVIAPRAAIPAFRSTGHAAHGRATWFCRTGVSSCTSGYPGGMYAAAGSEIRVGNWRGRTVRVCSGGRCVFVQLIDWCACGGSRVIDLYSDAFRRLAPLSQGSLPATVSW